MRVLLKKTETGEYFAGPEKWTKDPKQAYNFKTIDQALNFIRTWFITDVELEFSPTDQSNENITVPKVDWQNGQG